MPFARQTPLPQRVPDLSRFVDTPRQQKDPCFHCTLWDCVVEEEPDKCPFLNTNFGTGRSGLRVERQGLIDELIDKGVIVRVAGNGVIEFPSTETPEERRRRQNREHMRRKRAERKAA